VIIVFAVIKTGGKQYKVEKDNIIKIEKLAGDVGSEVKFEEVLMFGAEQGGTIVGSPLVKGASVTAEILSQTRDTKVLVFKKRRRQNSRRKNGHRQDVTHVKIKSITKGKK
jgi:large subunit ribosomal protein L21